MYCINNKLRQNRFEPFCFGGRTFLYVNRMYVTDPALKDCGVKQNRGSKPQPPKFPECTNFALGNLYVRPPLTGQQRNSCLERKITARNVSHSWYG
ncbi:hypothetical protein DSD72_24010 [Salmonella enterica]|nr:hypothetical protein [Salmonella enterica]EBI5405557.1 hypothetical protein [Salmonella enterica]